VNFLVVHRCLGDATRVRILSLLLEGPLCVGHLAAILKVDQAKVSRHLKVLKAADAVVTQRCHNWTIYRLNRRPDALLKANLRHLKAARAAEPILTRDLAARVRILAQLQATCGDDLPAELRCIVRGTC